MNTNEKLFGAVVGDVVVVETVDVYLIGKLTSISNDEVVLDRPYVKQVKGWRADPALICPSDNMRHKNWFGLQRRQILHCFPWSQNAD
jgi:hypothetical protein